MKRIPCIATIVALLIGSHAATAQSFEGTLGLSASGNGKTYEADAVISGPKARIVPLGDQSADQYPVFDYGKGKVVLVSTKDRYYTEMPLDSALKAVSSLSMTIGSTGRRENIRGMDAEEYKAVDKAKGIEVTLWATAALKVEPYFLLGLQQQGGAEGAQIAKAAMMLFDKGLLPLRIECAGKGGSAPFRWEVTKIERKAVASESFDVPSGYQSLSSYLKKNVQTPRGR